MDINLSKETLKECIKETNHFSHRVYENICSGETYTVANGSVDYLILITTALFIFAVIGVLVSMIVMSWR